METRIVTIGAKYEKGSQVEQELNDWLKLRPSLVDLVVDSEV